MRLAALVLTALILSACQPVTPAQQAANQWPPNQQATVLCLVHYESGGDPNQISSTGDFGILQIHKSSWRRTFEQWSGRSWDPAIFDPVLNSRFARDVIYREAGSFRPWSTHRKCHV